ncbi:MAG: hypothetical protein VX154_04535 [Pseudomonadota bacterium]|nr:hypothetical protein [Pseudomonadota bacterium]
MKELQHIPAKPEVNSNHYTATELTPADKEFIKEQFTNSIQSLSNHDFFLVDHTFKGCETHKAAIAYWQELEQKNKTAPSQRDTPYIREENPIK